MKRRKTARIGGRLAALLLTLVVSQRAEPVQKPEPAVVAGTIFREPGFALPGAEVILTVKTPPEGVKPPKRQKILANQRGEFSFHVPPFRAEYRVMARARGFAAEEKIVIVSGGPERVDAYLTLKPAVKEGK